MLLGEHGFPCVIVSPRLVYVFPAVGLPMSITGSPTIGVIVASVGWPV